MQIKADTSYKHIISSYQTEHTKSVIIKNVARLYWYVACHLIKKKIEILPQKFANLTQNYFWGLATLEDCSLWVGRSS